MLDRLAGVIQSHYGIPVLGQPQHVVPGAAAKIKKVLHMVGVQNGRKRAGPLLTPIEILPALTEGAKDLIPVDCRGVLHLTSSVF